MTQFPETDRLQRAKRAFTTRRVESSAMRTILSSGVVPKAGDLVLARVDIVSQHKRLELVSGRKAILFPGDEVIVCYGNRYAPDQFEAEVGADLGPCHLIAGGGVAATALSRHERVAPATAITPIGLIGDLDGVPLNLEAYALPAPIGAPSVPSVTVLGTSMNAGKTTAAAWLIRGLAAGGHRVGAIKLTGTGSGGDLWMMEDAGASSIVDFTDAGFASTYLLQRQDLETICRTLTGHLALSGCDVIVCEVADGLYQREVAQLLRLPLFRSLFKTIVFSAQDALGAVAGAALAETLGFRVAAISGRLGQSPLAVKEAAAESGIPCYAPDELGGAEAAERIVFGQGLRATAS